MFSICYSWFIPNTDRHAQTNNSPVVYTASKFIRWPTNFKDPAKRRFEWRRDPLYREKFNDFFVFSPLPDSTKPTKN